MRLQKVGLGLVPVCACGGRRVSCRAASKTYRQSGPAGLRSEQLEPLRSLGYLSGDGK